MKKTDADIIRDILKSVGFIRRPADIFALCGVDTIRDKDSVRSNLAAFRRNGELRKEGDGYRYIGKIRPETFYIADRVWRAWRYCSVWTVAEIARIAECKMDNVQLLTCQYKKAGYVEAVGKRGNYKLYRLKDRDMRRPGVKHG